MSTIIPFLLQGASLGLTASISPGPLFFYLISQSLMGGWKRGAIVAIAPLISDIPLVIIILLLLGQIPAYFLPLISILGGLYLIYLAWSLFLKWRQYHGVKLVETGQLSHSLGKAILVNYLSPGPYLFWTLVNGPLLLQALRLSVLHGIGFLVSFYGLFIGSMLILVIIFSQVKRLGQRMVDALSLLSAIILHIFGIVLIVRGISGVYG